MPLPLTLRFVRTAGQRDRVYVEREDGWTTSWAFPSYGPSLPHDLVHLIFERSLHIRLGVWGLVARGLDLARINEAANRRGGKRKYEREIGYPLDDLYVAEAMTGLVTDAAWLDAAATDDACLAAAHRTLDEGTLVAPATLDLVGVRSLRRQLDHRSEEWRSLGAAGTLVERYIPAS